VHCPRQRPGPLCQLGQVGGGAERPRQPLGEGLAAAVEDPRQAVGVDRPRVAVVRQRPRELCPVADQAVPGQLPGQVLLARVAPVEGADPDLGPGGDRGDRGGRVGQEDLAGRVQDLYVVAGRLPAARAVAEPLRAYGAYAAALAGAAELLRYLGRDPQWSSAAPGR